MMNQAAILLYGALTIILTFGVSLWAGSFWGMALTAGSAGVTYVFQVMQEIDTPDWLLNLTWLLIVVAVITAWVFAACA